MPYFKTVFDTSVDPDAHETLEVSPTPKTSRKVLGTCVLVVASGTDVFVDVGVDADVETSAALVTTARPIMFGIETPESVVSVKSVGNGTGWVTLYYM